MESGFKEDIEWNLKFGKLELMEDEILLTFELPAKGGKEEKKAKEERKISIKCAPRSGRNDVTEVLWVGGLLLCDFLMENRTFFSKPDVVLELGAGVGLFGVLFRELIPSDTNQRLILSDLRVSEFCKKNLDETVVELVDFDWKDAQQIEKIIGESNSVVVVGGDLVYDGDINILLIDVLKVLFSLESKDVVAFLAMERRMVWVAGDTEASSPAYTMFFEIAEKLFQCEKVDCETYLPYKRTEYDEVWKITKR